jgi:hypothetical protein
VLTVVQVGSASSSILPPLSVQAVLLSAERVEHRPSLHTARTQAVAGAGHSLDVLQGVHSSVTPSQTLPLFVQEVLARTTSQTLHVIPLEAG